MTKTLFERLGGRNGISMIVDDTVENHMNNSAVNARFLPFKEKPEQLANIKNHTIDFFSAGYFMVLKRHDNFKINNKPTLN